MQSDLESLRIPSEFVDYRRRLIVHGDEKGWADRFAPIHSFLIHGYGALEKVMEFEFEVRERERERERLVRVFYLTDESKSVDEAIQVLRQEFQDSIKDLILEPDVRMGLTALQVNDPLGAQQWALEKIEAQAAWDRVAQMPLPAQPINVAIIDSGIKEDHEDLAVVVNPPPVPPPIEGTRFIPPINGPAADDTGHGTML